MCTRTGDLKLTLTQSNCHDNAMFEILVTEIDDITIINEPIILISLYRSPRAPLKQLFSDLDIIMRKYE